jgi:hypothetical protein
MLMSRSIYAPLAAVMVTALTALALCSCGGNEKEVVFQSGGMTHTFTTGNATDTKNFPLPIYPNAKASGEVQAKGDPEDNSKFLLLSSADKVDQVSEFYNSQLKAQGWEVNETVKQPTLVNLGAHKNDIEASVMISEDADGKTTISLAVSNETKGTPKMSDQVFTPDKLNPPTD